MSENYLRQMKNIKTQTKNLWASEHNKQRETHTLHSEAAENQVYRDPKTNQRQGYSLLKVSKI